VVNLPLSGAADARPAGGLAAAFSNIIP